MVVLFSRKIGNLVFGIFCLRYAVVFCMTLGVIGDSGTVVLLFVCNTLPVFTKHLAKDIVITSLEILVFCFQV